MQIQDPIEPNDQTSNSDDEVNPQERSYEDRLSECTDNFIEMAENGNLEMAKLEQFAHHLSIGSQVEVPLPKDDSDREQAEPLSIINNHKELIMQKIAPDHTEFVLVQYQINWVISELDAHVRKEVLSRGITTETFTETEAPSAIESINDQIKRDHIIKLILGVKNPNGTPESQRTLGAIIRHIAIPNILNASRINTFLKQYKLNLE